MWGVLRGSRRKEVLNDTLWAPVLRLLYAAGDEAETGVPNLSQACQSDAVVQALLWGRVTHFDHRVLYIGISKLAKGFATSQAS